jgi:ABC-2 type transport system permease protein
LIGWSAGFLALGFLLGAVGKTVTAVTDMPEFNHWLAEIGAHDPAHAFLRIIIYVLGQVMSAYAITAALMLRSEEAGRRAEPILAAPVSRLRWAASHLIFAAAGPAVALAAAGVAIGVGYGLGTGGGAHEIGNMLAITIRTVPAVWVIGGVAALMFGVVPRYASRMSWIVLIGCLVLELGWELRQMSQAIFDISPFAYVHWTVATVPVASVAYLTLTAAMLTAAGLAAFNRRDIG